MNRVATKFAGRLGVAVGLCVGLVGMASAASVAPAWSLVPVPVNAQPDARQAVTIADRATIAVTGTEHAKVLAIAQQFAQRVDTTRGLHLRVGAADKHSAITFNVDPHAGVTGDAGYRLTVDSAGIRVTARTPRGAFYGGVTLWQLLTPAGWTRGAPAKVAGGVIWDHPRFAWRGVMLDSGRHFQSVADIKRLIDWMSLDKLNVLLWHITDDQGWRLEVPKYPELTKVGACRKAVGLDIELTGSPDKPYCGFYTQAQVRDVVHYAAEHYITVVPGLDLPGHSQAAVAAYPWLGVTGKRPQVWTDWGISPWLLKPDARTLQFVDDVLDEVMQLFPSKYISIGGDEADKAQWNASPVVQAHMHKLGLKDMNALQAWFMGKVADHLIKHGRIPVGWDDQIAEGGTLPAGQVVMAWHAGDAGKVALKAIRQGHDVLMTPEKTLYFDHYQSTLPDEWPGRPNMITLKDVYDTVIVPDGATPAEAKRIVGMQAQLWAELMPTFARNQHGLFPRIAALSELAWSPAATRDWGNFLVRMPAELARYQALGIGYADSAFAPAIDVAAAADGKLQVALSNQAHFGTIYYTTNGAAPTRASTQYTAPVTFAAQGETTLRAATFAADGFALSRPRAEVLNRDTLRTRNGNALQFCSRQPAMRLGGNQPADRSRPVYKVDIGNMCWRWRAVPLDGATQVRLTVARLAWRYGDVGEGGGIVVRPKASAAGEFKIHSGSCDGPLLATLPLTPALHSRYQTTLTADISANASSGTRDLCIVATGDPRDGQWALARVAFTGK